MDSKGNTYVCEREGHGVRKINANGIMSTFAGTGEKGYSGDGGPALASTWNGPKAIRCDHQDNILVVDTENHAIRRIDTVTGVVTTVAGDTWEPMATAVILLPRDWTVPTGLA